MILLILRSGLWALSRALPAPVAGRPGRPAGAGWGARAEHGPAPRQPRPLEPRPLGACGAEGGSGPVAGRRSASQARARVGLAAAAGPGRGLRAGVQQLSTRAGVLQGARARALQGARAQRRPPFAGQVPPPQSSLAWAELGGGGCCAKGACSLPGRSGWRARVAGVAQARCGGPGVRPWLAPPSPAPPPPRTNGGPAALCRRHQHHTGPAVFWRGAATACSAARQGGVQLPLVPGAPGEPRDRRGGPLVSRRAARTAPGG
jgi:hypothetical protein